MSSSQYFRRCVQIIPNFGIGIACELPIILRFLRVRSSQLWQFYSIGFRGIQKLRRGVFVARILSQSESHVLIFVFLHFENTIHVLLVTLRTKIAAVFWHIEIGFNKIM